MNRTVSTREMSRRRDQAIVKSSSPESAQNRALELSLEEQVRRGKVKPEVAEKLKELQEQAVTAEGSGGVLQPGSQDSSSSLPSSSPSSSSSSQFRKQNNAYTEKRLEDEAVLLTKMMKVIHPNPVKMFACGTEVVLMLLETGELYIWCDDDPHPKLMNGHFNVPLARMRDDSAARSIAGGPGAEPGGSTVDILLDDHRVYWTEHELRVMANEKNHSGEPVGYKKLCTLASRMGVSLFSRDEIVRRIKVASAHTQEELEKLPTAQLSHIATKLGVLANPSPDTLIRAIIKHRLQSSVFVKHVAAGGHHFAAVTTHPSKNLWTWGLNDKGQLGLGDTDSRVLPACVDSLPSTAQTVQCGDKFTMCVLDNGDVYSWGQGEHGQLGHSNRHGVVNTAKPVPIVAENVLTPRRIDVISEKAQVLRNKGNKSGSSSSPSSAASTATVTAIIGNKTREEKTSQASTHVEDGDEDVTSLLQSSINRGEKSLLVAAGGNQAVAWTSKYPPEDGVFLEDHENLEYWKQEAFEKFHRLKSLRTMHDELHRARGFPDACPRYAETVLCEPSKQELERENQRRQLCILQKANYFPEICMVEGATHMVARNCRSCFGRGYTRDRFLTQLDVCIEEKVKQLKEKKLANDRAQRGISSTLRSIIKQGSEVDRVHAERRRLSEKLASAQNEEDQIRQHASQNSSQTNDVMVESMLKRLKEQRKAIEAQIMSCTQRENLCRKELESLRSQAHSARVQLLSNQTEYNNTDTELMLFRRVRIRRQKRLAWNMIAQREAYIRRVIVAAHELWSKAEAAEFSRLLNDQETVQTLKQDYGIVDNDDSQIYELIIKLSSRKLNGLMKESIKRMQRFKLTSIRFEGQIVMGDCVKGWLEKDTKGRPRLRVRSPNGKEYCHLYQQPGAECSLPCPYGCVHERMPEKLRQQALRRQGFKGNDLIPVRHGKETHLLDKPFLYCSFYQYSKVEAHYVRKIRVYVDGKGMGDGVQQIYGVIFRNKESSLLPTTLLAGGISDAVDIERGKSAGWIDLPFPTPVALPCEDGSGGGVKETKGVWLGLFAAHGGSVVRLYGKRCEANSTNISAGEMFRTVEVPGEFPAPVQMPFRAAIYAETSGLWSRLLAVVLDSCRLRLRTNNLGLTMLIERRKRRGRGRDVYG